MTDSTSSQPQPQSASDAGRLLGVFFLTVLGLLLGLVGLYYLTNPCAETFELSCTVNLQRLAFGQTFTLCGAVFLAVAWRPR